MTTATVHQMTSDAGTMIHREVERAIDLAARMANTVEFEFNGVTVRVRGDSDYSLILRDWGRALQGLIPSPVGPYPKELTAEETEADREKFRRKERREYIASTRRCLESLAEPIGEVLMIRGKEGVRPLAVVLSALLELEQA